MAAHRGSIAHTVQDQDSENVVLLNIAYAHHSRLSTAALDPQLTIAMIGVTDSNLWGGFPKVIKEVFQNGGEMSNRTETYAKAETFAVQALYLQGFLLCLISDEPYHLRHWSFKE